MALSASRSTRTLSTFPLTKGRVAVLLLLGMGTSSWAQTTDTVTITGRAPAKPGIGGFGDQPVSISPLQASSLGSGQRADEGISSIGALTRWDASLGDAYNADGYWASLSARGYTLDNRFNYRRDGLPISAETAIALDNKEQLELLKGTSGIQAGASAPGGLINLIIKRPEGTTRMAELAWRGANSLLARVDLGDRFGADGRFGLRLNAAVEHLDPATRDTRGHRSLFALAADWRVSPSTLIEAEVERSRQSQPSVVAFSLLGNSVPEARAIDARLNLNRQPWSQPVVFDGDTASLRWQQRLSADWRFNAHAMTQQLRTDDRTAFPYGVYDANYECADWCDRFAPDGSFTYWEYISNNERRRSDALDLSVAGTLQTGPVQHNLQAGVLSTRYKARFEDQIFDIAGPGRIDGQLVSPASAGFTDANTNRDERSTEAYLRDVMRLSGPWSLWAGLRHTRLDRASVRTSEGSDDLRATRYQQSATVPWLALAWALSPQTTVYASWGEGLESDVVPNRDRYSNRGMPLPTLKSRQAEVGIKHASDRLELALTWFDIDRPQAADLGDCDAPGSCERVIDGSARHRGLEANALLRDGPWTWQASAMLLNASRRGSSQPDVNGKRPVNVPATSLRAHASYRVAQVPGLDLGLGWTAEGNKVVLPYDDSVRVPAWSRVDLNGRWKTRSASGITWTLRAGIDNLLDRRAWKEAPYQFGHAYLYPLTPRTWRTSIEASF